MATPGGVVVATLPKGTRVTRGAMRNGFTELPLEGWVFGTSLGATTRDGFDLAVTPPAGENLRASANGPIIARLRTGAGFTKVSAKGGWTEVRRSVWIAVASLGEPAPAVAAVDSSSRAPTDSGTAPSSAPAASVARLRLAREGALFLTPDKGRIATIASGSLLEPVARSGGWVKVKVEGWVREQDIAGTVAEPGALITAADLRATPAKYEGESVNWRVQFVAVRTADELRPELLVGQAYALVRGPLPEPGFVYVALSEAQAAAFRALAPLAELSIRATIRTARTRYTGTPVVELVAITGGG